MIKHPLESAATVVDDFCKALFQVILQVILFEIQNQYLNQNSLGSEIKMKKEGGIYDGKN